jgi:gamma-glutamyl-gamma-aminobutyrate hydrolase PuuD
MFMVKVFEAVKIHHYGSGSNRDRHELRNSRDELNIIAYSKSVVHYFPFGGICRLA